MEYVITPFARATHTLTWWDNIFNTEELNILQELAINANICADVGEYGDTAIIEKMRRSKVYWLSYNNDSAIFYEKLSFVISSLNASIFNYDLTGFGEPLQLTNYESSNKGTYDWHVDSGAGLNINRKLSLSLQLSDPDSYEGGILEVLDGDNAIQIPKKRGYISVFPSFSRHRVTPVTKGSRQSLVVWVSGPPFR